MRPTIDGLNSSEWFHVTAVLAAVTLAAVLAWLVARWLGQGLRFLIERRQAERAERDAWLDQQRERQFRSATPRGYLRERSRGLVSDAPTPWPLNDNRERSDGRR